LLFSCEEFSQPFPFVGKVWYKQKNIIVVK
jgi:hypothetical protein